MKKIFPLFTCMFLIYQLYAIDGRAIRSNWECMSTVENCVAVGPHQTMNFSISLLFYPNQSNQIPTLFLNAEIDGVGQRVAISAEDINNGPQTTKITSFDSNGAPVIETVVMLTYQFTLNAAQGAQDFSYNFSLFAAGGSPYPIGNYPNLMAMIKPQPGWGDYTVHTPNDITLNGSKDLCTRACNSQIPMLRTNTKESVTSKLTVYPNPFSDRVTLGYETRTPGTSTVIELIDTQGKTVKQMMRNEETVGRHSVELELGAVANGIYLLKISDDVSVQTIKLVKR